MSKKSKLLSKDEVLSNILSKFDKEDKNLVALELVKEFRLDKDGETYPIQVKALLGRELTAGECFILDTLYRILNFHGRGSGILSVCPPAPPKL